MARMNCSWAWKPGFARWICSCAEEARAELVELGRGEGRIANDIGRNRQHLLDVVAQAGDRNGTLARRRTGTR